QLQRIGVDKKFYHFLYEKIKEKKINISQNTLMEIAYLSYDKEILKQCILEKYNEKNLISLLSRMSFYYDIKKKQNFLIEFTKIVIDNDLLTADFIPRYTDFLNNTHCLKKVFPNFQNYFKKINYNGPDLINYYKIKFGETAVSKIKISTPDSIYGKRIMSMREFEKGNYGNLMSRIPEFRFIDGILAKKALAPEDILGYLKQNVNMDLMTLMRYLYFQKYDIKRNTTLLKEYALTKFLNEIPNIIVQEEFTIFLKIYYDFRSNKLEDLKKDYDNYQDRLNFFKKICNQMMEKLENDK
ncbi:hypothetical protein J7L48_06545, partial [bacterium]|nr:hypothetical protein [bacterium]